jgi:hypothetical protein
MRYDIVLVKYLMLRTSDSYVFIVSNEQKHKLNYLLTKRSKKDISKQKQKLPSMYGELHDSIIKSLMMCSKAAVNSRFRNKVERQSIKNKYANSQKAVIWYQHEHPQPSLPLTDTFVQFKQNSY